MKNEVFLDSSYAIALSSLTDEHHDRAGELAERIRAEETRLITTRAVVLEIGNAMPDYATGEPPSRCSTHWRTILP